MTGSQGERSREERGNANRTRRHLGKDQKKNEKGRAGLHAGTAKVAQRGGEGQAWLGQSVLWAEPEGPGGGTREACRALSRNPVLVPQPACSRWPAPCPRQHESRPSEADTRGSSSRGRRALSPSAGHHCTGNLPAAADGAVCPVSSWHCRGHTLASLTTTRRANMNQSILHRSFGGKGQRERL